MSKNITNEIVDAGVAEELVELEYIYRLKNTADPKYSIGYKITHKINYSNYYLVVDELSSNILQKVDGHIRRAKLLYEKA